MFDDPARRRRISGLAKITFESDGVRLKPYIVQHDNYRSPHLIVNQPFKYPNLPIRYQDLLRSLDRVIYYLERIGYVIYDRGVRKGIREVASIV